MQTKIEFLKNDNLKTILPEWRGNPYSNNEFLYTDAPFRANPKDFFRWITSLNPQYIQRVFWAADKMAELCLPAIGELILI